MARRAIQTQISLMPDDRQYLEARKEATGIPMSTYLRLLLAADRKGQVADTANLISTTVAQVSESESSK